MELQELIISAAMDEFKDKGLKFTMNDIAKRLYISKKTIYTVFASKEELMDAIADYAYKDIKLAEQRVCEQNIDIVQKIREIIIALPDNYREFDFRNLNTLKDKYPSTYMKVIANIENNWETTFSLINQGIEEGRIKPFNIVVFKEMISATIEHFISSSVLCDAEIEYNDALQDMMNIIMKGIEAYA